MPERVWLTSPFLDGEVEGSVHDPRNTSYTIYVPESRLLAAEARAKAMEDGPLDYMSGKCDRLKEENAVLEARVREVEAERDAIGDEVDAGLHNGALHLLICNGDHHIPLWDVKPGVLCNCPIGQHFKKLHRDLATLRAERDALQADLKALLPLARLGLLAIDANSYFPVRAIEWGLIDWHRRDTANLTAARAILDREGV